LSGSWRSASGAISGRRRRPLAKGSLQAAARAARYRFLEQALAASGLRTIALGHTADDLVEGVILHLLRGAGLAGMRGMPERRGPFVRPLLGVWRSEVEQFLEARATVHHVRLPVATVDHVVAGATADVVLAAAAIAEVCAALIAGTNDLRADLRLPLDANRDPISAALQLIVLAARAAAIACFDGVFNRLDDAEGFAREAGDGRRLGFDGKSLIHPNQIALCHEAFAPAAAEIERAEALVEAFGGGAERFGNEMIERMHVEAAQRVIARARH